MMVVGWVGFGLVVVAVAIGCVGNLLSNINYFILLCRNIILMSKIGNKNWDVESDVKLYGINNKVGSEMEK